MKAEDILYKDLLERIEKVKEEIKSAEGCLNDLNFLQCAVRLQKAGKETNFDTLHLNIMDSMSGQK